MFKMSSILATCLGLLIPITGHADPVKLKFGFFGPTTDFTWVTTFKPFIDAVNAEGKGIVEIESYPNGALSRNLPQQPQIVLDGVVDMAFVIPAITPGRFADNALMELPGIFKSIRDSTIAYTSLTGAGKLRGYEKYYVVGAFGAAPSGIHTRAAIATLDSFANLKIRATNPMEQKVVRALGAASILLPTNDAAEAIARGTIDGTAMQPVPLVDFGISKLTNYHYFASLGVSPLAVLMNREKFEALPAPARAIIEKYSGDWIGKLYYTGLTAETDKIIQGWKADPRQKLIYPTAAERARLDMIYTKIDEDWAAESPNNAALLSTLQNEVAKINAEL